jgi:alkylation response protein AidB-like acyl-CoA dehydrogenase
MTLAPLHAEPDSAEAARLRIEVRDFLHTELAAGAFKPQCDGWLRGFDPAFTRLLGQRGWLGMTWPACYGGRDRPQDERYVVVEELLAAGAPVAAHWVAERQVGPSILRHGSEFLKKTLLPPITRGQSFFALGYSEPDVGSDLASVGTRAVKVNGGWVVTGTKVWTSQGHHADHLLVLCRTSADVTVKQRGLSMLIAELPSDGIMVRPIRLLTGEHHFNEVVFDKAFVPDEMLLGEAGTGWQIVTADLAVERSGPERFMSTLPLLSRFVHRVSDIGEGDPNADRARIALGELIARLWSLRSMSRGVAKLLDQGSSPAVEAALVKDLGTRFEAEIAESVRRTFDVLPSMNDDDPLADHVAQAVLHSPAYTLRGGTNEILRGIVARGLGLR